MIHGLLQGWRVAAPGNQLQLRIKISSNAPADSDVYKPEDDADIQRNVDATSDAVARAWQQRRKSVLLPTADHKAAAKMIFETTAFIGANRTAANVTLDADGDVTTITFPGSDGIWYDPELVAVPVGGSSSAASVGASALAALLAVGAAMASLK